VWDADGDAVVCLNGTLELSTGILRPHHPDDRATVALPFAFDPHARADTWRRYLADTVARVGEGVVEFFQEFAGYCLTPDTSHEIALWFYSPPGRGKSTAITGLQAMLGGKGSPLHGVLSLGDIGASRFALADLPGKRLLVASEQPTGRLERSDRLNAIISGETINVEQKNRDPYPIKPTAKIAWAMNDLPRVTEAHNGVFRRVKVIKLPPLAAIDPGVKERIEQEGPGIFAWALEGLHRLRERGRFEIPEAVERACEEFQRSNDVAAHFVEDRCDVGAGYSVRPAALYAAYAQWCRNNGFIPKNSTNMKAEWERLGFPQKRRQGVNFYVGLRLTACAPEPFLPAGRPPRAWDGAWDDDAQAAPAA
jgi:putative DNA primase/helicase